MKIILVLDANCFFLNHYSTHLENYFYCLVILVLITAAITKYSKFYYDC